jgi:hypothetical protein
VLDAIDDRLHRDDDLLASRDARIEANLELPVHRLNPHVDDSLDLLATRHNL